MNIVCVICSDNLQPSDDVFYTPCGHIFHYPCLTQWLERSRTCPQCREKTTQSKIHRIYFNFSNNDTIVEDATSLQATVDSLKFQILIKDREIKQSNTKNDTLKKETSGLRAEVRKLESQLAEKETAMYAFRDQLNYFKEMSAGAENAKKEVARLKKKLDELRNLQMLLNAPGEDVEELISSTQDPATLITYISVMKRELATSVSKRKQSRDFIKKLQQDLTKVSMERNFLSEEHAKRRQLEEDLAVSESRMMEKDRRIRELEKMIPADQRTKNLEIKKTVIPASKTFILDETSDGKDNARCLPTLSDVVDLCEDSPVPRKKRSSMIIADDSDLVVVSPQPEKIQGNEENSPYLRCKGLGYGMDVRKRKTNIAAGSASYSILAKKPRISGSDASSRVEIDVTYDGFGGHSKFDKFPSPKKANKEAKKPSRAPPRKSKLDDGYNRKLGNFVNNQS